MKHRKIKRILVRKKRIKQLSSLDALIKVEVNYCIDEIIYKISLLTNEYDENLLHEIRISLRKLKSLIYFFKSFLSKEEFSTIKIIIRQLITPTAKVRDYDIVKANYIDPSYLENNHDNDFKTFMIHSSNEIHNLQEKVLKKLLSHEYKNSLVKLKIRVNDCAWRDSSKQYSATSLGKYIVVNINKELDDIYKNISNCYQQSQKKLHHLRIKIKEIRYVIELFKFYIKHYKNILANLKYFQDTLGEINDTYVAGSVINELNITKYLTSQHEYIEKRILDHRKSNILKLKNQI